MPWPIPCPNCLRFVPSDVVNCPHCGLLRPGERWRRRLTSWLTDDPRLLPRIIVWVSVAWFVLSLLASPRGVGLSANPFSLLSPSDQSLLLLGATGTLPVARLGRWWTLLTATWLHGGVLHLLFNMVALTQVGPLVVREYGGGRAASLYVLTGVAGFLVSVLAGVPFTIGASASVCGFIGAALYYGRSRGGVYGRAVFQTLWGWALGIFLFGLLLPGINNWAHGGGMAAGFLLGSALGYRERAPEQAWHRWLGLACGAVTVAALGWGGVGTLLVLAGR